MKKECSFNVPGSCPLPSGQKMLSIDAHFDGKGEEDEYIEFEYEEPSTNSRQKVTIYIECICYEQADGSCDWECNVTDVVIHD